MPRKMKPQRPGKRKSPSRNVVFEVSDNDVSPEHSDSDIDEPEAKIFKPQSAFVESVVNALDDLEAEAACVDVEPVAELTSTNIPVELTPANIPEVEQNVDTQDNNEADELSITRQDNLEVSSIDKVSNLSSQVGIDKEKEVVEVDENSKEVTPEINTEINANKMEDEQIDKNISQHIDSKITEEENTPNKSEMMEISHPDDTDQHIRISFSDEKTSELYKFKFLKFLQTFVELEVESDDKLNISVKRDTLLNPTEWVVLDATMCLTEHEPNPVTPNSMPLKDKTPKKKKRKEKKDKGLFVLDPNPSASENNTYSIYSSKFNIDLATENEEQDNIKISTQTCFNCDGSHALKDCPAPKDFGRISAMRQKFKAQRQVSRYHLEDDQKYSHLVPGKISSQLREALGLKKKQLPFYIYRMRELGYPPGWLEEAKSVNSNLNMFDADGNNVRQTVKQKQGLDPEKIVDFPGFNVPMEKNFEDEFRQHRVPPYSENYSKQVMLDFFEKQNVNNDSDMDVDSPNDDSVLQNTPKTISPVHADEDSITELVKQKEILLEALQDNNSASDVKTDNIKNGKIIEDSVVSQTTIKNEDSVLEISQYSQSTLSILVSETLNNEVNEDCALSPPLNDSISCIKGSAFGTPILKSGSPYSTIPKSDNFMKDVSPVINFENLPNSTGKYEQMTTVLQKVRKTLKQKQDCDT